MISAEDNERLEHDDDIEQQMGVDAEVNDSAIDRNDELMHHDISALGTSEVESEISATNKRPRVIITKKRKVCSIDT